MVIFMITRVYAMTSSIIKSLMKPAAYPVPTSSVELIQTHVSWLFLTETNVFKLKKPVNFGFLDFSTVDRRRFYCNEELRLNRRLSPDIYEAVVELRESGAGAAFHGTGPIIDYAVMMKRLPADRMLDRLVEQCEATMADMKNLADIICSFHAEALRTAYIAGFGSLEKILFNWRENIEQLIPFEATTLPVDERENIYSWVKNFAEINCDLFSRRVEHGFIRECDGDLHLENICLVDGRIYIFDCIEFNERFRFCDTAADVAFLLMDLDFHGRSDLSDMVIRSYIELSGDTELSKLIDFYKIYRAVVRGKVESFRLNDLGISADDRDIAKKRAIRYFRLARGYIERHRLRPTLFITCGTMGCGKSTLAEQLAFELGIKVYNSDIIRKQHAGIPPDTAVLDKYGQGLYSQSISVTTYGELLRMAECELSSGSSTIVDASFISAGERAHFAGLALRRNVEFVIISVSCDHEVQKRRLEARAAECHSVSDGRVDLLNFQKLDFECPTEIEGRVIVVSSNDTLEHLTTMIYEELRQ